MLAAIYGNIYHQYTPNVRDPMGICISSHIYIPLKAHRDLSILKMLHISPPQAPQEIHTSSPRLGPHIQYGDSDGISMGFTSVEWIIFIYIYAMI